MVFRCWSALSSPRCLWSSCFSLRWINTALGPLPPWGDVPLHCSGSSPALFRPVMWLIGVPWAESRRSGALMATKTVLNEFVAYLEFAKLPAGGVRAAHARLILTYALCGFANFGSLGILIGGLGAMVPERRREIVALGLAFDPVRHPRDLHERRGRRPAGRLRGRTKVGRQAP